MNGTIALGRGEPKIAQVRDIVAIREETWLTIHAPNDHVLWNAGSIEARQSSHCQTS